MAEIICKATAGTSEGSDVLVTVEPADELTVVINSTVFEQFSNAILETVKNVLSENGIEKGLITIADKGALDWIIRARTEAAIARGRSERA